MSKAHHDEPLRWHSLYIPLVAWFLLAFFFIIFLPFPGILGGLLAAGSRGCCGPEPSG